MLPSKFPIIDTIIEHFSDKQSCLTTFYLILYYGLYQLCLSVKFHYLDEIVLSVFQCNVQFICSYLKTRVHYVYIFCKGRHMYITCI